MSTTEGHSHPSGAGQSAAELLGAQGREGYAEVGDQRLHYIEAGKGPLIVLLHGFPEFWYGWRLQIKPLAAAGFRVVAPDTRGYNLSSNRMASPPTTPASWPPTSAVSSTNAPPRPRCWSATTGAARLPGRRR